MKLNEYLEPTYLPHNEPRSQFDCILKSVFLLAGNLRKTSGTTFWRFAILIEKRNTILIDQIRKKCMSAGKFPLQ